MRKIKFPSLENVKLAEFVGCLLGDGYMEAKYEISITENSSLDVCHSSYVYSLFEDLFGIRPFIFVSRKRKAIRCKVYSKDLQEFLISRLGLVKGKKTKNDKLKIPKIFLEREEYTKACLRGIFDTDGCFCRHRIKDPLIEIDSSNESLRSSIITALEKLDFSVSSSGRKIYIYSKNDIRKFFKVVGSNNIRNTIKYMFWLKNGIVPKTNEIKTTNGRILEKIRNSKSRDWTKLEIKDLYGFNLKVDNTCVDSLTGRTSSFCV
jgi:DNA-binding transcriptional regulator WhiA